MARLILHVGPGKCGSSSIQHFFATQKSPCIQNIHYKPLNPSLISELNIREPSASLSESFAQQLSLDFAGYDFLILSHEFLFQNPCAIRNICFFAKNLAEKITIIGYSRRQSNFLVSSYSQWLFRSPERINEVNKALDRLKINPVFFTGLERQIIASVENDFYSARQLSGYRILNWNNSYNNIFQRIHEFSVEIKPGVLPNKESDTPLIQDFCAKAGLLLRPKMKDASLNITNLSFNHDIVEAINNAVAMGFEMMGPRERNDVINLLSDLVTTTKESSDFLYNLKSYVDSFFWEPNQEFCKKYNIDKAYFEPSKKFNKKEIKDMIIDEEKFRSLNKLDIIERYRILSARMIKLCIEMA